MWWAVPEIGGADFGDARLTPRLVPLINRLSERPATSIPQACESWAMTKASSRFFANPRVTAAAIMAAHRRATVQRGAQSPVILAVQDSPPLNFTRHRPTPGLGPIGQAGLSGCFLHSCLAVSPAGVPVGLWGSMTWVHRKTAIVPINTAPWRIQKVAGGSI
jgi:hypothetical protein